MNLLLYDFAMYRSLNDVTSGATSADLCKGNLFPSTEVCPLCYHESRDIGTGKRKRRRGRTDDNDRQFESRRVVLRYLYAVYTSDKVIVLA